MITRIVNECDMDQVLELLKQGQVIAFPTETVYGLGVIVRQDALARLNEVKQRPADKPYTFMIPDWQYACQLAEVSPRDAAIMARFMPGPLTVLLPKKDIIPAFLTAGLDTIGCRCPDHPFVLRLLQALREPLLVPSCNVSGDIPARNFTEAYEKMNGKIPLIVNGPAGAGKPSTILDCIKFRIVRAGPVTMEMIEEVLYENRNGL